MTQSKSESGKDLHQLIRPLSKEQLAAVQKFVEEVGGAENARQVLDQLAKLKIAA